MSNDVTPKQADRHPDIVHESVYTISEVCRILRISRSTFFERRRTGHWSIPTMEPGPAHPRFSGLNVLRYLRGEFASVHRRHMRSVAR